MRNKGLGKFIMQILQLIAHRYVKKVKKQCMYKRAEGIIIIVRDWRCNIFKGVHFLFCVILHDLDDGSELLNIFCLEKFDLWHDFVCSLF